MADIDNLKGGTYALKAVADGDGNITTQWVTE